MSAIACLTNVQLQSFEEVSAQNRKVERKIIQVNKMLRFTFLYHQLSSYPSQDNLPKYKPSLVRDDGALQLLDPYVPTSHQVHKRFSRHELGGYPKKDAATYWRCEDYPHAWGHGTKHK